MTAKEWLQIPEQDLPAKLAEVLMQRCKDCKWVDPYTEWETTNYDTAYGWCEKKKKDVGILGEYGCARWHPHQKAAAIVMEGKKE